MQDRAHTGGQRRLARAPRPDRIVMLRASLSRRLVDRLAALPSRVMVILNAAAFVSLAASLLILLLV